MKKIKFHIDDYGVLPKINKNILNYIKNDKIDSISIICNTWFSKNYINELLNLIKKKKLDVSCHINLTEFLVKKYKFTFAKLFYYSLFPNSKVKRIISNLIKEQINVFLSKIPLKNKTIFIDGHEHIHILPIVQNEIIKILKKKKLSFKFRNSNENFIINPNFSKKMFLNYIKLLTIKFIYLIFNQNKNYLNENFIGVIATGNQSKKIIIKSLSKLNLEKSYTQVLFHPLKIEKIYLESLKLTPEDYKYYLSDERNIEINFFKNIKSKNNFLKKNL
jgi:chitin disaccharide deacetylase